MYGSKQIKRIKVATPPASPPPKKRKPAKVDPQPNPSGNKDNRPEEQAAG